MKFIINKNLYAECEYYETRYSWGHKGWLYRDHQEIGYKKITYYNRTWERYQFESLLQCLVENKQLTEKEQKLFIKKIENNWKEDDEKRTNQTFRTVGMIASLGDIFCQTQTDKNKWKARMLKAGLTGLDLPADWDALPEEEKEIRLNEVVNLSINK